MKNGRSEDRRGGRPPVLLRIPHVGSAQEEPVVPPSRNWGRVLSYLAGAPLLTLALWLGWELAETAADDAFIADSTSLLAGLDASRPTSPPAAVKQRAPFTTPPLAAAIAKGQRQDVEEIVELTETPADDATANTSVSR